MRRRHHLLRLLLVATLAAVPALALPAVVGAQIPLLYSLSNLQNPPGITWRRIDAPHFTVIYPDSMESEAQRAAGLLERAYAPLTKTLGRRPERIPVVLTNRSMVSNAYVAWAPRRSQWYALPPTNVDGMGPVDWYSLLATHEGRHVVQERAVRTGLIGVASRLFGEYTTSFLAGGLYFPAWFWEGDAVGTETALTSDGRGRQPTFTQRIRALRAAREPYGYYQAWGGSYRTYYPDWYEQGYVLTTHVRRKYGEDAWPAAIRRAARNPIAPMALSRALRHVTGRSLVQLQRDAVAELDTLWERQRAAVAETPATVRTPATESYHEWLYPQYAGDGSIIALYGDLSTVRRLVRLRGDTAETLVDQVGIVGDLQFHVAGERAVWSEYEVSPRWGEENFLVLKSLDLRTRKVTRLTNRSRYFGAALSPDASRIVAIDFSLSRQSTPVILDAANGRELQRLPNLAGHFLVTPVWASDASAVYVVAVDRTRGNALVRLAVDGTASDTLIPFTHDAISRPFVRGTRIFFGSPRSGIDNLYTLDPATRRVQQVTSRPFGAMFGSVSPDGARLAFSDYSLRGYDVAESLLDSATWRDAPATKPLGYAEPLVAQESGGSILDSVHAATNGSDGAPWPSRPYTGLARLFDLHSLTLAPTSDGFNAGLALESRNLLNTFGLTAGGVFNMNERTAAFETGASYAGLPVIVDVAARLGSRASSFTDSTGGSVAYSWRERSLNTSLRLPLSRVVGRTRQSLVAAAGVGLTHVSDQPVEFRFENNNGSFAPVTWSVFASHVRAAAYRDLFPTGATLAALYRHTPFGGDYRSHQLSARGALYLPGLFANHSLVLDAAREEQRPDNYRFSAQYLFPRGYSSRFHERFTRAGATYHLPLLYPDLALGPWLYVRRVQGALFGDAARGSARTGAAVRDYRSVGSEVTADVSPFSLRLTIRTGWRVSRTLTDGGKTVGEWVVYF